MINLKWKGPTMDPSGYGKANRDYISALTNNGAEILVEPWNFEAKSPSFYGKQGLLVESLKENQIPYDVVIHHYVPNRVEPLIESKKFNIAYNTWETDKIPSHWVENLNTYFDGVMVPSNFNRVAYERSGVEIPIEVVPHCIDSKDLLMENYSRCLPQNCGEPFKFLSVFQWTERKNPIGLLKAYFSAFYGRDDVLLVLKCYRSNTSEYQTNLIKDEIRNLKSDMRLSKTPPIYLVSKLLTHQDLVDLYCSCDCFVLPTRGEGFGIPIAEAMACGLPTVVTNFGGQKEFCTKDTSFLINYQLTPVAHMPWIPHYDGTQNWAEPDLNHLKLTMLTLAKDKNQVGREKAVMAKNYLTHNFNPKIIADRFMSAVEKICTFRG